MHSTAKFPKILTCPVRAITLMVDLVGGDIISLILFTGTLEILMDGVPWLRMSPVDQVFVCKEADCHGYQH